MNNKKTSEDTVKKNNINIMFINFMHFKKFCWRYFGAKLFTIILYLIFSFIAVLTAGAASDHDVKGTYSTDVQLSPYNYLKQHASLPVDFLFSVYQAKDTLWEKLPKAKHPFFATVKYEKKETLTRKPLRPSFVPTTDLNGLLSYGAGDDYIAQKELISFASIPLYSWLLREYSSVYYGDSDNQSMVTVTIAGMLFDLQQREQNNDATARVVLEFLRRPYVQAVSAESSGNDGFFYRLLQPIQRLFLPSEERSFLVQFDMLRDLPNTEVKNRFGQLFFLKEQGYEYKKNYTFISYETDKTGEAVALSSDDIIQTSAKVEKTLNDDYLTLNDGAYKTGISTSFISKILRMQTGSSISKKLCGSFFSGIVFLSMINNALASALPPRCEAEGTCNPQNYHSLFNNNFVDTLGNNPTGHFKLGENINLDAQQNLPVFQNCSQPFSGTFETGGYVVNGGNGTSPLFACIEQASVSGNFNFCLNGQMQNQPVIANNVLNGNTVNMQQVGGCDIQRPALGDISGHNNQVTFTGRSAAMRVADNTGIIANRVSGDNNRIIAQEGQSLNAPVVSVAGGNNNTYYQRNMRITRSTANYLPSNEMLAANQFTGNGTTVRQHNINATFITRDFSALNDNAANTQNGTVTTFSSDTVVQLYPPEQTLRITNSSDNSAQRTVITNNGRLETFRNGGWKPLCEDTVDQKTTNVVCKSKGYIKAENEAERFLLKDSLPTITLDTAPVHANKECTGYESNLKQCSNAEIPNAGACRQNKETFLSCSNEITPMLMNTRLTDPNSNSTARFDTSNTRIGRLEVNDSGELKTVCSKGFDDNSANVYCNGAGSSGGYVIFNGTVPLPESMPILSANWSCVGNESRLFDCPYINLSNPQCTHENDVIVACLDANPVSVRLTDRSSTGEYRADTTATGLGRVELYNSKFRKGYLAFFPCNFNNRVVGAVCRQLGFRGGVRSYLDAPSIPNVLQLHRTLSCGNRGCSVSFNFVESCHSSSENIVILCNNGTQTNPQIAPKICPESDHTSSKSIIFSGELNSATNCELSQCPVKLWDVDGVKASRVFKRLCDGTKELHTTTIEDWMKMWNFQCKDNPDNCSCHVANKQILGVAYQDDNLNETLLVSRQKYPYNTASNQNGLIQVSKLFSGETPQSLRQGNETDTLKPRALAVNYLVIEQNLLGLYSSGQITGDSVQLVWSSLDPDNHEYQSETFDIGSPLLLTNDTVMVSNKRSRTIDYYPLNITASDDNMTMFGIDYEPYKSISFHDDMSTVHTVTTQNDWMYALGNAGRSSQIVVVRYNTVTASWDPYFFRSYPRHSVDIHYKMIVTDRGGNGGYNINVQLLSPEKIPLVDQRIVSINDSGGCVLLEKTEAIVLTEQPSNGNDNGEVKENNNNIALIGTAAIPVALVAIAAGGICCYKCNKGKTVILSNVNTEDTTDHVENHGLDETNVDGDQTEFLLKDETDETDL